jgi:hypothetical protein
MRGRTECALSKPKRLPGNSSHLQKLVGEEAKVREVPPVRVQRWLNAMVVTAVLSRVRDEDDEPLFLVKGGVAMELRLQLRARTTKDFDAAFRGRAEEVIEKLDEAIAEPWNEFRITRLAPVQVGDTPATRVVLKLTYKTRSWGTVPVELAPVEGNMGTERDRVPATPLDSLQIPTPEDVPCVSVRYQVAQKLHACTERFEPGENERYRDIMDILLLEDLLRTDGLHQAREACVDIFQTRDKQPWPPEVVIYDIWRLGFAKLARDNGFEPSDIDEAVDCVRALIADIAAAT